jgi:uncharacterized protein
LNILAGQQPQVVVPAGVWQGSHLHPGEYDFALLGATATPGFDFADWEQRKRSDLIGQFPDQSERIRELNRV